MNCEAYREQAAFCYQELLMARNDYERRLFQRQLNNFVNLIGVDVWKPIRDRVRNDVKRGRIQHVSFYGRPKGTP